MNNSKKRIWNGTAELISCTHTAAKSIFLKIKADIIAKSVTAGQFVYIKTSGASEPLLRRAFSVMDADPAKGVIELYIDVKGPGTESLAALTKGDHIDLMGPLGRGFQKNTFTENNILVGGGCGVAPLIMLAKEIKRSGKKVTFCYGGRTKAQLVFIPILKKLADNLIITTDDGTAGHKGVITKFIDTKHTYSVYSCGPKPMLKALSAIFPNAYVALETEMACGIGVCMGCTVPMASGGYKRCCTEGPVFSASEVLWN
ncbi:MAG: dihydroorotate dehydrogenase electron transfer subunit [Fibrobacteres bacterium]|nr:dihydroorotate dehydrogenase electron transfer subunit [Fibrobacterota bacterium]